MMKKLNLLFLLLLVTQLVVSQSNRAMFQMGATANYYNSDNGLSKVSYNNSKLSYGLTAAIGIDTYHTNDRAKNTFAFFGCFGFLSDELARDYISDQNLIYEVDSVKNSSDFQELEFGAITQQVFRLSFGYGWFNFYDKNQKFTTLNYYTATSGVIISLGSIKWSVNITAMQGRDFEKLVFRPSTSLVLKLD